MRANFVNLKLAEMQLSVRSFEHADAPQLLELANEALDGLDGRRGGSAYRELFLEFRDLEVTDVEQRLVQANTEVLVGLLEGHVFALCLMVYQDAVLTVEALYVDPEAREVGLGTALLQAAQLRARELNCSRFEALALPGDRQMKQRAESEAMKARLLVLSKALGERP